MNLAPLPVTLHSSKLRWVTALLLCILFVPGGIYMSHAPGWTERTHWMGWAGVVFFGACIPVLIAKLCMPADYLTIRHEGIEYSLFFGRTNLRWSDISSFSVHTPRHRGKDLKPMVGLIYNDSAPVSRATREQTLDRIGCEGMLPYTYGLTAAELCDRLNRYLEQSR